MIQATECHYSLVGGTEPLAETVETYLCRMIIPRSQTSKQKLLHLSVLLCRVCGRSCFRSSGIEAKNSWRLLGETERRDQIRSIDLTNIDRSTHDEQWERELLGGIRSIQINEMREGCGDLQPPGDATRSRDSLSLPTELVPPLELSSPQLQGCEGCIVRARWISISFFSNSRELPSLVAGARRPLCRS